MGSSWAGRSPVPARAQRNLEKTQFTSSVKAAPLSYEQGEQSIHIAALKCAWTKQNVILTNIFNMRFKLRCVAWKASQQFSAAKGFLWKHCGAAMNLCKGLLSSPGQRGSFRAGWRVPSVSCPPAPIAASAQSTTASLSRSCMQLAYAQCQLYFRVHQLEFLCREGSNQSIMFPVHIPTVTDL